MTQARRLTGGLIERQRPLNFEFDGKSFTGYPGDTLASALLANGVQLMGRSFKYHRPRGPFTSGSEEPNAIVELREGARKEPNTRATTIEPAANKKVLIRQNDIQTRPACHQRRNQTSWPATNDQQIAMQKPFVITIRVSL